MIHRTREEIGKDKEIECILRSYNYVIATDIKLGICSTILIFTSSSLPCFTSFISKLLQLNKSNQIGFLTAALIPTTHFFN